jgi:Protein of unknown function (DUF3574)
MNLPTIVPARPSTSGPRGLVLSLALVACATSVAVGAPTAFGQALLVRPDAGVSQAAGGDRDAGDCARRAGPEGSTPFLRTELYFGSNKPDGSVVSQEEFQHFLDQEISPRFPDGLTLVTGLGQFRGSNGLIQRERSMLLILLYPAHLAKSSVQKIEEIRTAYKWQFRQESVLRADEPRPECISF